MAPIHISPPSPSSASSSSPASSASSPSSAASAAFAAVSSAAPSAASSSPPWSAAKSASLYKIHAWGSPYFTVNASGHVAVCPFGSDTDPHEEIDILQALAGASLQGAPSLSSPVIVRFPDVLRHRLETLHKAFEESMEEVGYHSHYQGVYPVKCNQDRFVVENVVEFGKPYRFGLEAGSKAELVLAMATLSQAGKKKKKEKKEKEKKEKEKKEEEEEEKIDPETLLICNGYKDMDYIRLAFIAAKIGLNCIVVLEQEEELELVMRARQELGIGIGIGIGELEEEELESVDRAHQELGLGIKNGIGIRKLEQEEEELELVDRAHQELRIGIGVGELEQEEELESVDRARQELRIGIGIKNRIGTGELKLGIRAKLSTRHDGHFGGTSGERGKFGLSSSQIVGVFNRLKQRKMLRSLSLLHFHIGSQIPDLSVLREGISEAARIYCELRAMGANWLRYMDIGGGLGIDYDGSACPESGMSVGYSIREYSREVVVAIAESCAVGKGIEQPIVVSESGRALVSHHSVLVFDVLSSRSPGHAQGERGVPLQIDRQFPEELRSLHSKLVHALCSSDRPSWAEEYAAEMKACSLGFFKRGRLSLSQLAAVHTLYETAMAYVQEKKQRRRQKKTHEETWGHNAVYQMNLSVFTSMPDTWAIGQLFPIVPLHRLNERPTVRAVLSDLTCDSDGKVTEFVATSHDGEGQNQKNSKPKTKQNHQKTKKKMVLMEMKEQKKKKKKQKEEQQKQEKKKKKGWRMNYLSVHALEEGKPYYLGMFLAGAYQEALGGSHNLFGALPVVQISRGRCPGVNAGRPVVIQVSHGERVSDVLTRMQYEPQAMLESLCCRVRRGSLEEGEEAEEAEEAESEPMIQTLASSFAGSTYLAAPRDPLPVSHL